MSYLGISQSQDSPQASLKSSKQVLSRPRVLIVDDEEHIGIILGRMLERGGYHHVVATSTKEARELMGACLFQAVLCDVKMPGESGIELMRWILEHHPDTAVVAVTVVSDPQGAAQILDLGIHGYITKPFNSEMVLINLSLALRRKALEKENRTYQERLEKLLEEKTGSLNKAIKGLEITKKALKKSQERYWNLFDRVPIGLFRTTPEGRILEANTALVEMLGAKGRQEILSTLASEFYADPLDRIRWKAKLEKEGTVRRFEKKLKRKDGSIIWVEDNTRAIRDEKGHLVCFEGSIQDITQRKITEEALKESRRRFLELFENAPVGYFEYDREGKIFNANTTYAHLLGYSKEEILGKYIWELFCESETGRAEILAKLSGSAPPAKGLERYYRRKDGSIMVGLIEDRLRLDQEGRVHSIRCTVQDITERKRMEEELKRAHDEKELILSSISSMLISINPLHIVTEWNRPAALTLGVEKDSAIGRSFWDLPINWDKKRVREGIKRCIKTNQTVRVDDLPFVRTDGREGFLGLTFSPLGRDRGTQGGVLILGADITERKILERQLVQAQKLEALGQLAAGIAHEINTPIQYIGDNLNFFKTAFQSIVELLDQMMSLLEIGSSPSEDQQRAIKDIKTRMEEVDLDYLREEIPKALAQSAEGVGRVAAIVKAMKEFSHPGKREPMAVDINKALVNTITVCRNEWKYVAELTTDLDPSLPVVYCDPGELNQVFLNLIVNAAQAIGEVVGDGSRGKGRITVSTRNCGPCVEVRVEDTGCGIPPEIRSRIFDPFFTTKEVGRGTGQGLTICHDIVVKKLKGTIDFDSKVDKGTTFIVRLPASSQQKGEIREG